MIQRLAIAALCAAPWIWAADPAELQRTGYVNDFAGVVSAEAEQEINRYLKRVDESTKAQIAIVTIPSLDGAPIEDFTIELARRWGVGYKDKTKGGTAAGDQGNQGVLLLFAIRDRKMRLEVGYGAEDAIPDGFAGELLRSARPALRAGNYSTAMGQMAHVLGERIAAKRGVTIAERIPAGRRVAGDRLDIPWPVIIIGVIFLLWFFSRAGRGGPGGRYGRGGPGVVFIPPFGGGGWGGGGSSSGGFGGYDSSDSFGGFGGGDFGGGGASSDW